ncbi:MAG TPA: hypothetical protein VF701_14030 [Thermoanaerobaculia bacterium]
MNVSKRQRVLIGLGAVVIAMAVVFSVWPPAVSEDDAVGTIGAVQKFRAKQMGAEDIVLGDETSRREAKILFVDHLTDAAKLQNIAADLGMVTDLSNRQQLGSFDAALASHQADLQSRFVANATQSLEMATQMLGSESLALSSKQLGSLTAELQSISADLNNRLGSAEMQNLSNRLGNVAAELGMQVELSNIETQLSNSLEMLQSRNLGVQSVELASKQLGMVAASLNSQSLDVTLQNRSAHLGAMALESMTLENSRKELGAIIELGQAANLENQVELQGRLANIVAELGSQASRLESAALDQLQSRLAMQSELSSRLANMQADLGSFSLASISLENRQSLGNVEQLLGSISSRLGSFEAALQSKALGSMQVQLGMIGAHLDHLSQLESRLGMSAELGAKQLGMQANLANVAELGARGNLGQAAELGAKGNLGQAAELGAQSRLGSMQLGIAASLGSFQQHLGSLSQSLEAQSSLGSRLGNRQELASQAVELQNRVSNLQNRANQN